MKKAFITGITGQDGSYLAELLLKKGYEVHGLIRRSSSFNTERLNTIYQAPHTPHQQFFLHYGDLSDASVINKLLRQIKPDEIYNLGAQSHVRVSFDMPEYTGDIDGLGTLRLLEGLLDSGLTHTKFYQASSSEMYGKVQEVPQKETTPFYPRSPYACAKVYAYWLAVNYRESYNLFISNGILFNHESPRRGATFVTKKIIDGLGAIKERRQEILYLGNLDAKRDWGYAPDYVEGMWQILQHTTPDDFVLATGETHTIREFIEEAAPYFGFILEWEGKELQEKGIDKKTGKTIIEIDSRYFRPTEVDMLLGDASKAKEILGWEPKVKFKQLVKIMAEEELRDNTSNF